MYFAFFIYRDVWCLGCSLSTFCQMNIWWWWWWWCYLLDIKLIYFQKDSYPSWNYTGLMTGNLINHATMPSSALKQRSSYRPQQPMVRMPRSYGCFCCCCCCCQLALTVSTISISHSSAASLILLSSAIFFRQLVRFTEQFTFQSNTRSFHHDNTLEPDHLNVA